MRILSLFDGISCARVALERAGISIEKYFASEVDKYAIQIAQKNYPDTEQLGDIKDIDCTGGKLHYGKGKLAETEIDLICGGSPCQDLSIAKKNRKGLDGERSGLFWEYVRILKEVKPKYFILENVASMPKEAKEAITKELGVEPIMINAALVSAQNRKRLFWTNIPNVSQPDDRSIFLKDIVQTDSFYGLYSDYNNKCIYEKVYTIGTGCGTSRSSTFQQVILKPVRIAKIGKGGQGDRVYSIEGKSVTLSANGGGRGAKTGLYAVKEFVRKLTPVECERLQSLPDNYTQYEMGLQKDNIFDNIKVWKNALSKIVKGKKKPTSERVLCTIKDIRGMELLNCLQEQKKNVYIAIDFQSQENSAANIIKIGIGTKTHFLQISCEKKQGIPLIDMDIKEGQLTELNTEMLWKSISKENLEDKKLFIISILSKLITQLEISISAQNLNTNYYIANLNELLQNSSSVELYDLKKGNIELISNAQRYKCLGNAFNVEVVSWILQHIK